MMGASTSRARYPEPLLCLRWARSFKRRAFSRMKSLASLLPTRTETQPFHSPATGLTSLSREIFEAFARPVRRVSSLTLCSGGAWRKFSQSAGASRSFCGWWPKRRFFSSSKMRTPARRAANQHASSKPPARDADRSDEVAPTHWAKCCLIEEKRSILRLKRFRDLCAQPQSQPAQADESGRIALIVR
jgi:hypothetical protein